MTINFKQTAVAMLITCSMSATSLATETEQEISTEKQEKITHLTGFGSGVVIGGLIAGPAGAIVAGFVGALIGEDINKTKQISNANQALLVKQTELRDMQLAFVQLKQENEAQLAAFDAAVSESETAENYIPEVIANIQFKTASFLIEEHYKGQLDVVASQLKDNPNLKVELSGFADTRGDSHYNHVLSEQRNASVKDYLISKWVPENQIITQAFGETNLVSHDSVDQEKSMEDNFFDRRVMMRVSTKLNNKMTAATDM